MLLLMVCIAVILSTISCKKGDTGPQGPEGNANVIYSQWFTPATYKKDTLFGSWGFSHTEPAAAITQSILDSGAVFVFAKLLGYNPAVWPATQVGHLPITISYIQSGVTQNDTWSSRAFVGNIKIRFVNDHNIYNVIATQHQFRYIIVPGGTVGRMNPQSYKEISALYNIPD